MISRGKLFISGGGKAKDSFLLDKAFVNTLQNKKILYIPIGLKRDIIGYEECYNWIRNTLSVHTDEVLDISMWVDLGKEADKDLKTFDAIYIGGAGDAYNLLKQMRKVKFIASLLKFFRDGGILYGGSAGAVIMGKYIIPMNNGMNQKSKLGLGLLKNYSIYCHYSKNYDKILKRFIDNYNRPVISIPENSGFIFDRNKISVVGYNQIIIFNLDSRRRYVKPNENFII